MQQKLIVLIRRLLRPLFPQWIVNYLYHLPIAYLAARFYGNPARDLEIIGVTGTDGKTTTSLMIYHILKTAKKRVAVISTVEAKIGRKSIKTGFHVTSPDPWKLQRLLRSIRSQKYRYVVLEVTSHGLDQFRLYPIRPKIAVLTNITHEHLDYHKTFEEYRDTKLKLFRHAKHAVISKDLPVFSSVNARLPGVLFSTYSLATDSQLKATSVKFLKGRTKFSLGSVNYELPLSGKYNLYNALGAISACLILGVPPLIIKRALASFPGVKGRLEQIENKRGIHAYVDFAHTPNALYEVLTAVRAEMHQGENLIVVFGAAGQRDASKRPLMGKHAASLADHLVVTSEDPRSEDPGEIAREIITGVAKDKKTRVTIELDRGKAIDLAVNTIAKPGDWVIACGKGHEESMNLDGFHETPWSDQLALKNALERKL